MGETVSTLDISSVLHEHSISIRVTVVFHVNNSFTCGGRAFYFSYLATQLTTVSIDIILCSYGHKYCFVIYIYSCSLDI